MVRQPSAHALTFYRLQQYRCNMLPDLIALAGSPWAVLPPGVHTANLHAVKERFAINPGRRVQFGGLVSALENLRKASCGRVFLDGSYITAKPKPGDFDACWDPLGVDPALLDPVFLIFDNQRAAQKKKYKGEFFPSCAPADLVGTTFVEFFQVDRFTGAQKGIVVIDLASDLMLQTSVKL
jgi:hypothetical protein